MTRAAQKQAVEQRTQQRLAARQEAVKKGAETRRRKREELPAEVAAKMSTLKKHEAKLAAESKKMRDAESAAGVQKQEAPVANQPTQCPERKLAQAERAGGPMVTVALRGESAQRFRALAAGQEMSLSKLLVRMMEVFETATGGAQQSK